MSSLVFRPFFDMLSRYIVNIVFSPFRHHGFLSLVTGTFSALLCVISFPLELRLKSNVPERVVLKHNIMAPVRLVARGVLTFGFIFYL